MIEKDWLQFGHKFLDRCGHAGANADANEISPVFLQWLAAVHQLHAQFPTAFEFDETYLVSYLQTNFSLPKTGDCSLYLCIWCYLDALPVLLSSYLTSDSPCLSVLLLCTGELGCVILLVDSCLSCDCAAVWAYESLWDCLIHWNVLIILFRWAFRWYMQVYISVTLNWM